VLPRVKKLGEFAAHVEPFLLDVVHYDPAAVEKHLNTAGLGEHVGALADAFEQLAAFDEASSEEALRCLAGMRGVKAGTLIHATRVALTGRAVSPGLFEVAALVGQPRTVARLRELERFLRARVG
jgi:nondiscriminating glutamyl-tRNA synthetase